MLRAQVIFNFFVDKKRTSSLKIKIYRVLDMINPMPVYLSKANKVFQLFEKWTLINIHFTLQQLK